MTQPHPLHAPSAAPAGGTRPRTGADPEVLRCNNTADFLAALPRLVGFTASNSLFVVLFTGARAGSALRIDLPASERPAATGPYIDAVCGQLAALRASHGAAAPAVVIASATGFAHADGHPWRLLAQRIERRFAANGHPVRELCCLAPDGWVSYLDGAAPPLGRPLSEIAESPLSVGEDIPDLAELGALPEPSVSERAAVAAALPAQGDEGNGTARVLFGRGEAPPELVASVITQLNTERGWLGAFSSFVRCAEIVAGRTPAHPRRDPSPGSGEHVSPPPVRHPGHRPDYRSARQHTTRPGQASAAAARLALACERLSLCAALSPPELRPAVLAASATAWWLRGLQSVAHRHIAEALRLDPANDTARTVARLFGDGHFPSPTPRGTAPQLWEDSSPVDIPQTRD